MTKNVIETGRNQSDGFPSDNNTTETGTMFFRLPRGFPRHRYRVVLPYLEGSTGPHKLILDVGGFSDNAVLEDLLPEAPVYSVNIHNEYHGRHGHVTYNGEHLPFPDDCFPVVISVDVLEHVPKQHRAKLIEEMVRVASHRVIISAPFASDKNLKHEADLLKALETAGLPPKQSLVEHKKFGLPTLLELENIATATGRRFQIQPATNAEIDFAGLSAQICALLEIQNNPIIALNCAKGIVDRTEKELEKNPPKSWDEAYRAVLVIDK